MAKQRYLGKYFLNSKTLRGMAQVIDKLYGKDAECAEVNLYSTIDKRTRKPTIKVVFAFGPDDIVLDN
jgi:hypothetical protein